MSKLTLKKGLTFEADGHKYEVVTMNIAKQTVTIKVDNGEPAEFVRSKALELLAKSQDPAAGAAAEAAATKAPKVKQYNRFKMANGQEATVVKQDKDKIEYQPKGEGRTVTVTRHYFEHDLVAGNHVTVLQ